MTRIHNDIVDNVVDKTDIVEVISAKIPLKKTGRNYKAVCPFHGEKTPSFVVSPDKQIFHCFGCGIGGNVITFLIRYDKLTFREALKILADKANIKLPEMRSSSSVPNSLFDKLYELNERAKEFYKLYLFGSNGKQSLKYLKERGLTEDSIRLFQLGYAPNLWEGLLSYLKPKDINNTQLVEKAGLILSREHNKGYYDRFRNRIIFPIFDVRNKIIGFGARALDNSQPKYINSPETPIYNKGRNLYGLNFSKGHIREKDYAIIVEGYLDLIIPFQNGVKNIVATLGTALTSDQIRLLKRSSKTVVIVFDSDKAGEEASLRGLDILISLDMNVRIATLPKGYDPDTFVRNHGASAFEQLIKSSKDLFDYKMGLLMKRFNKDGVRGRAAIATLMLPTIARIPSDILKASFLKKLSDMLSLDESALKTELQKVKKDYSYSVSLEEPNIKKKKMRYAELLLLSIILDDPEAIAVVDEEIGVAQFREDKIKDIIGAVKDKCKKGKHMTPSRLITHFDDEESKNIISKAVGMIDTMTDKQKVLFDCMNRIREDNFKEALSKLREEIGFAQSSKDYDKVKSLVSEYNTLLKTHKA